MYSYWYLVFGRLNKRLSCNHGISIATKVAVWALILTSLLLWLWWMDPVSASYPTAGPVSHTVPKKDSPHQVARSHTKYHRTHDLQYQWNRGIPGDCTTLPARNLRSASLPPRGPPSAAATGVPTFCTSVYCRSYVGMPPVGVMEVLQRTTKQMQLAVLCRTYVGMPNVD